MRKKLEKVHYKCNYAYFMNMTPALFTLYFNAIGADVHTHYRYSDFPRCYVHVHLLGLRAEV